MEPIEISVVIPVYNSEQCLEDLSCEISAALKDVVYELILVNDKSRDKSWEKIVAITQNNHRVTGLNLRKNSGQDNAIMAGLSQCRGEYIVIMDDDLQHSPADIAKLHQKIKEGFDVCYGFFSDKKQTVWKNLGSKVNGYVAEIFLKKPEGLYLSPFKILSRGIVDAIINYKGPFPYVDGIILSITSNIAQVELKHHRRRAGSGNYNFVRSVSVFLKHVTGYSLYPLRLATIIGILSAGLSFSLGLYFLIDYFTNQAHVEGWITLVLLIVFFNGLMLMCIGLIGEYVGRIYLTVTARPQFAIDKIVSSEKDQFTPADSRFENA
jgi:undecaprenyl-phosphate 4-deoxy-4-formamido-L-arabinose transferase